MLELTSRACAAGSLTKLTAGAMCAILVQHQPEGAILVDESLTSGGAYWEAAKVTMIR